MKSSRRILVEQSVQSDGFNAVAGTALVSGLLSVSATACALTACGTQDKILHFRIYTDMDTAR